MVISKSTTLDVEVDVRESMRNLPNFLQPLLTWITGKPLKGQTPLFRRSNLSHLFTAYSMLLGGAMLTSIGVSTLQISSIIFILSGWILTVGGARKIITSINHYCIHEDFLPMNWSKKFPRAQFLITELNSIICFLQCFDDYKEEHMTHHQVKCVATMRDPDMVFMWLLGFKPGMSKAALWRNFYWTFFRPRFHFLFFAARLKSNFKKGALIRNLVVILYLISLAGLAIIFSWQVILIAWIFPLTILYHASALLQFCSEHRWLKDTDEMGTVDQMSTKERLDRAKTLTLGRFSGEATPGSTQGWFHTFILWSGWYLKMLLIHLPVRLFALPGDLVQHDLHHRAKKGDDWANAIYTRQLVIDNLSFQDEPFGEVWGLRNAIDGVFTSLSELSPISPSHEEKNDAKEVILAM